MHLSIAISFHVISSIACFIICRLIHMYLKSKPLGQQTLLDKFITEFIKAYVLVIMVLHAVFFCMGYAVPLNEIGGKLGLFGTNFAIQLFCIVLTATIAVRYLSVFHPEAIDFKITDAEVIRRTQIAYLLLAT